MSMIKKYYRESDDGMKYILVDAVEVVELTPENVKEVAEWCNGQVTTEYDALTPEVKYVAINVPTPWGNRRASEGHYIIKESDAFVVLSPQSFHMMYKEA